MADSMALSPQMQQLLLQLQTFQQQYQTVALQKESLMIQKMEIEKALEELAKVKGKEEVYKAVGPILVKSTKENMTAELKERMETIGLKLKSTDKQEEKLRARIKELQENLQESLKGGKATAD